MMSRPAFSINDLVRARNAFAGGRGPAEAWARINTISLWRLDELGEQAGSRTWALLFAPVEPRSEQDGIGERLQHAVRSAGLGSLSLPAFWRLRTDRIAVSCVLVVYEIDAQRAVRLARRYGQMGVLSVQRIPYEEVVLLNVTNEQRVQLPQYDPAAIADALARVVGAAAVAVVYRATNAGESQLMGVAQRRLQTQEEFDAVAAGQAPRQK